MIKNSKCRLILKTDSQAVKADNCVAIFDTLPLELEKEIKEDFLLQ